jgi:hypothetical protein
MCLANPSAQKELDVRIAALLALARLAQLRGFDSSSKKASLRKLEVHFPEITFI